MQPRPASRVLRLAALTALLGFCAPSWSAVFCVDSPTALQDALTTAASNGEDDQVQIVQGTYVGNFVYATATEEFDLTVQGGWTSGCLSQETDPANTVFDGDEAGTVLVLSTSDIGMTFSLQGVTLQNGNSSNANGGGLYARVGGNSSVAVKDCLISNNKAESRGGGAYISNSWGDMPLSIDFESNIVRNNEAEWGAGLELYAYQGEVRLTNNVIENNVAQYYGGGVNAATRLGISVFERNRILSNVARDGGGLYVSGKWAEITITDNFIESNAAEDGGGVHMDTSSGYFSRSAIIANNIFQGNSSSTQGGGLIASGDNTKLLNNVFYGNESESGGGVLAVLSDDESKPLYFYNNIFFNCAATSNQGIDLLIENDVDSDFVPTPTILKNNNFDQSASGFYIELPITIDPSNLDAVDPLFVDAANGDLHLSPGSPMIDAGDPATPDLPEFDIEGTPRVLGASVDIGAYEYDDGSDPQRLLSIELDGTGTGSVTSDPAGIDCGADCAQAFVLDTPISLTARPAADAVFDGWSGDADCTDGLLTMDSNKTCTATFTAVHQLSITKAGEGIGTVTSTPSGIDCGNACSAPFYAGEDVDLTATPGSYSVFSAWGGDLDCADGQLRMSEDRSCTATFDPLYYTLLVLLPGTGEGTVTSTSEGIDCGTDCRSAFVGGTQVSLRAEAQPGSRFSGWAGACSGTAATCEVSITELTGVTANFTAAPTSVDSTLYVTATGGGRVTSTPSGVDCGAVCDAHFDTDVRVLLTATPENGQTFNGWLGACSGTEPCEVLMSADAGVMATFGAIQPGQVLMLQQERLTADASFSAPLVAVLGPILTISAGQKVTVEAGEQIRLLPGFRVENGATFEARIDRSLVP